MKGSIHNKLFQVCEEIQVSNEVKIIPVSSVKRNRSAVKYKKFLEREYPCRSFVVKAV
jgi:hypothetical protein